MMTTSRRSSVGARHCSTYARKIVPFIGPSITKGATIPSWRSPTTRVMVFQWPWGTDPTNRSPRGQRPRSLTKLVLVAVSSINTNLAGSSRPCLRIQRRRARATSARSCSLARRLFFDGDIMSLEKSPDRGATAWNSLLAHRRNDLIQGQIRLLGYQSQQPFHLLLQRRRTPAAQLCSGASAVTPALQPPHRRTGAQAEAFGRFPPRCSGHDGFDNAFTQVIRIGLRHRLGPPEPRINAARLAHSRTIGNPRFNFAGKRSRTADDGRQPGLRLSPIRLSSTARRAWDATSFLQYSVQLIRGPRTPQLAYSNAGVLEWAA